MSHKSHNDEDFSFDDHPIVDGYFLSAPVDSERQDPSPGFNATS